MGLAWLALSSDLSALEWAPGGTQGGDGTWDVSALNWLDGDTPAAWQPGEDVRFARPAGTVTVDGAIDAGDIVVEDSGYLFLLDNTESDKLHVSTLSGQPRIGFEGLINAGSDNYPALSTLQSAGLSFRPVGVQRVEAEFLPVLGGSPVISVLGNAGKLEYAGTWNADSGTIISWLRLEAGGHFVLTEEAEMYFIKEGFFTLQLWVHGDGTGTLELAEGFVADHTEAGLVRKGIGSIRMGAGTLISHHSQNLPLGYRPRADGSVQTNGHLVFENSPGSRWIVRGTDQVYPGAVWIFQGMEVITESDLIHVGVTEGSSNYTAQNGWSILKGVTVSKRGPGRLTLAGEQSYASGAVLDVQEGTLSLQSDPAAGRSLYGSVTGAQLTLQIAETGVAEWQTDGAIQSLFLNGDLLLDGELRLENGGLGIFGANSRTEVLLEDVTSPNRIVAGGPVMLNGELVVSQLPGLGAMAGDSWVVCEAPDISGTWTLIDRTSLDLQLVQDSTSVRLVVGPGATGQPGTVLIEDPFTDATGPWDDLSTVPRWGSPLANGTAFEYVDGVVRLKRDGTRDTTNYINYSSSNGLKTFTSLDYRFSEPVSHAGSEVTIDFRLRWPNVTDASGEGGRFMVLLNHAYPDGGLDLTPEGQPGSKYNNFSSDWWARPAYHLRLRNSTTRSGSSFLQYGGGVEPEGEYESTDNWWLPGFVSGAGQIAPGAGDDFPENSWVRTREGMARDSFTSFRYRVLPDRQELWRDDNDDGYLTDDELKATMPLPQSSPAPLYQYFDTFEGLRVFWNGNAASGPDTGQVELDWIRMIVQENLSPVANAGEDAFAQQLVEGMAPVVLDGSGSTDPEGDELLYVWLSGGQVLLATRSASAHLELPLGEHELELVVIDLGGNYSVDTANYSVTFGKARPIVDAGPDQSVTAANEWFGIVTVSGEGSFSPTNSIIRYRWSTGLEDHTLYVGPSPTAEVALPVGTHVLTLTVWDEEEAYSEGTTRVIVDPMDAGVTPEVIYRENFTRVGDGTEKGPWEVGWNLMRFDGDPVASIRYDGNAHRSLAWDASGNAPYMTRINANPTGTEYDVVNGGGHMWMNQMPYYVASPGEWMLWTEEYAIDQADWNITMLTFNAKDGSPEHVKVAPAVRIADQWYIGWDLRVETMYNWWRGYTIDMANTGWVLFDPSLTFSVVDADPVERLPEGVISAFGLYMFKDYAWYVNEIDNVAIWAVPAVGENPYREWVTTAFPQADLVDSGNASLFDPETDPDGDGWNNFWDYAMGRTHANASDPTAQPVTFLQDGSLVLDMPRNEKADNLFFNPLMSTDLMNWVPATNLVEPYTDPGSGLPRMRLVIPGAGEGSQFLRIEAGFME